MATIDDVDAHPMDSTGAGDDIDARLSRYVVQRNSQRQISEALKIVSYSHPVKLTVTAAHW